MEGRTAVATAPEQVKQLVENFNRNLAAYKSPAYNETELRVQFVNPFGLGKYRTTI